MSGKDEKVIIGTSRKRKRMENVQVTIMILACENDYYYVDFCENANPCWQFIHDWYYRHYHGNANCEWTEKHKPYCIWGGDVLENRPYELVDRVTFWCMHKFGMANVRGGTQYHEIELNESFTRHIHKELEKRRSST